jgi:hypothetical protein
MRKSWLLVTISFLISSVIKSQDNTAVVPMRVAVFTQLYLDSAFTEERLYKHEMQIPKYILPGLDFAEGLLIAADSLKQSENLEIGIYDTRSREQKIETLKNNNLFDSVHLIIGAVSGNDYRQLSDIALNYQIPFLSATFPNDGGVTKNPFTILLNPTIGVHCNAIIQFIQQSFPNSNLIFIQKKSAQDEKIKRMLESSNQSKGNKKALKWSTYIASENFHIDSVAHLLDSTKQNLIFCASFDERLATQCLNYPVYLKSYNLHFIGLPHWETLKEINLPKHKDKIIYYPTAFYNDGSTDFLNFQKIFLEKTQGKASDIAYKGYDAGMNFLQLLIKHKNNLINQINDPAFQKLIKYNFQPVKSSIKSQPDYFENKSVYLIKKQNGITTKMGKF